MVKANLVPGKFLSFLLGIFVGIILLVGGIAGAAFYAYKNVKVEKVLSILPSENEWLSSDYAEKTVEGLVKELSTLDGDTLTLQKLTEISPYLKEKLDEIMDKVDDLNLISLDRTVIYTTPITSLSSSFSDAVIISASLNSLSVKLGFTLPDMPIIKGGLDGNELWIYTAVNDNDEKEIDKAISIGDYTYYLLSYSYEEKATQLIESPTYILDNVTLDGDYLKVNGKFVYIKTSVVDGDTTYYRYEKVKSSNNNIVSQQKNSYTFTTDELYYKNDLNVSQEYAKYATSSGEKTLIYKVPQKYAYRHLYAKDGDNYIQATEENSNGYTIIDEYKNRELYLRDNVYTPISELTDDIKSNNVLYVKTNGIGDLPLTIGISALSSALDVNSLSLNQIGDYFGVTIKNDMINDVTDVPFCYLSGAMDSVINNIKLADVLDLNANSESILLYLAYGEYGVNYKFNGNEIEMIGNSEPRALSDVVDCINTLKISNVITINSSSPALMHAIKDWTLDDFNDQNKINSLKLSDVITFDDSSPQIIKAIKDVSVGNLGDAISNLTIEEIIGSVNKSDTVLYALKDCTIDNLGDTINKLSLQDLFPEQVYERHLLTTDEKALLTTTGNINTIPLYVYVKGNYEVYNSSTHGSVTTTDVYTDYVIAYDGTTYTNAAYANVCLYAYENDDFVEASEITGWQLPIDAPKCDYYYKDGETYSPATTDGDGLYTKSFLYYLDANEEIAEIELSAKRIDVKTEYKNKILFSLLSATQADANGEFAYANLYYFDIVNQSFKRVEATYNDTTGKFTVSDTYDTLFTHGNLVGIWKYLLLDSDKGYETISSINNIGKQISHACDNINNATIYMLINDGLITVEGDNVEADLEKYVNHDDDSSTPKVKLGDLTIGEMVTFIFHNISLLSA